VRRQTRIKQIRAALSFAPPAAGVPLNHLLGQSRPRSDGVLRRILTHRQVKAGRRAQGIRDEMAKANSWEGGILGFGCFGKISACATQKPEKP
jgi:hypothetical protein